MSLSVAQITTRLSEDRAFGSQLDKIFIAKLTDKQGAIMLYRRIIKDFTPDELSAMPIPGSKPPEKDDGTPRNALYDYYPETTRNGQKVPAGYRWNDIADGLNNDNILLKERISKFRSSKTEEVERNAIPGASEFRKLSGAQLDSMGKTAKDRQSTYRTNVKRAFNLCLQIQRIQDDYPAVDVQFHTIPGAQPDDDGYLPLETTSTPILVINAKTPMFGQPMTVNSFLRLNVDKALAAPVGAGTYEALLESASEGEAETPTGTGEGRQTFGRDQWHDVFGTGAFTLETKEGDNLLTVMLAEKDNDAFLLSFGKFYYACESKMKGAVAKKFTRLLEEEQAAEEKAKAERKAQLDAALAANEAARKANAENTAAIS